MLRHCVLIFKATAAMPCLRFENCNFQELGCTKPVSQLTRRGMTLKTDAFKMLSYSKTYNSNHTVVNSYVFIYRVSISHVHQQCAAEFFFEHFFAVDTGCSG